jgi:hypothetical protein
MKTVIEMAREAGIRDCTCNGSLGCLERFAELVRADEREACAKIANGGADGEDPFAASQLRIALPTKSEQGETHDRRP